jgi:Uma2 family endonuclease
MTSLAPQRRKFTVDSYYKMAEHGLLGEVRQVELINGDIIDMSPINSKHARIVDLITEALILHLRGEAIVRAQNPLSIGKKSEPEPDVLVAKFEHNRYGENHPVPGDVLLLIEVADSSLSFDRSIKKELYAKAGIPEYWIINLADEQVEIFQQPQDGEYQQMAVVKKTDHFSTTIQGEEVVFEKLFG